MVERLINEYVSRITVNDIDVFARSNGIILESDELDLVFGYVKNDYRTIIYGNPRGILDDLKSKLDPFTYQKIEELFIHFTNKFKSYL